MDPTAYELLEAGHLDTRLLEIATFPIPLRFPSSLFTKFSVLFVTIDQS